MKQRYTERDKNKILITLARKAERKNKQRAKNRATIRESA